MRVFEIEGCFIDLSSISAIADSTIEYSFGLYWAQFVVHLKLHKDPLIIQSARVTGDADFRYSGIYLRTSKISTEQRMDMLVRFSIVRMKLVRAWEAHLESPLIDKRLLT